MRRILSSLTQACSSGPCLLTRLCVVAALGLLVGLFVTSQGGCAHTRPGLNREAALYSAATNAVAGAASVVNTVPTPWQPFADAAIAVIATALAAWNTSHSRRLRELENGGNPVATVTPAPTAPAPKA